MIRSKFNTIMILILGSMFLFGFADSIDTSQPIGTDDPTEADDNMRRIQAAYQQRLNVDHVFELSGTTVDAANTGQHKKITFNTTIGDPTQVAGNAHLYMQFDELHYQDDTNPAFDLTSVGKLGSASTDLLANIAAISGTLDVTGNIDPTTYETTNGGFLDEDDMSSDAADKVASQQSIKKYVDDLIAANVTLSDYTTEDSESNAMLKSHAYLAQTDGTATCHLTAMTLNGILIGYVGNTTNPPSSSDNIVARYEAAGTDACSINFEVQAGKYFEIRISDATPGTVVIKWVSRGALLKPIDQD